jgi:sugar phosphate isomerase/epimerase
MRVGLFADGLADRPLAAVLDWLEANAPHVRDVEVGVGGYSPAPHCDVGALLASEPERRRWLEAITARGFRLAALNASGNPLDEPAHDRALRDAIRLAPLVGIDRVVCMSGGSREVAGGAWFPRLEQALERDWEGRVLPYWSEISELARAVHASLRLCLELEPGAAAYNVTTFERLAAVGANIAVNLDPSHLFWQGMDPLAVTARLSGRIGFAHGKDTVLAPEAVALDGVLQRTEPAAWRYATVGRGHPPGWWRRFAGALAAAGYDGVLSIEHEDEAVDAEAAIAEAAGVLRDVTARAAA